MSIRLISICMALAMFASCASAAQAADPAEDAAIAAVRKSGANLTAAFNAGKADGVTASFLPKGELIDEKGTVYQGTQEIKDLMTAFFEHFPGAKLALNVESIRMVGPVVIDEGTNTITTKDGAVKSQFRYLGIWAKTDAGWQLASFRDFDDDPAPTPHDNLEPVSWLVGDWLNEGSDGKVTISYRWSEDKNFILGDFQHTPDDGPVRKTSQRIGWDPAANKIRSWLFDADGGFAEGSWTLVDDEEIVIKSSTVNPDGVTASATVTITKASKDRFTIKGTERIVGDNREDDFELNVVRRPVTASKASKK